MLPVNTVNPADTEQMALTLNGKKRNLRRNDFLKFADACGLARTVAGRLIDKLIRDSKQFPILAERSYLTDSLKEELKSLIIDRVSAIS
jgi:serine/threonine-protein kinase HipA